MVGLKENREREEGIINYVVKKILLYIWLA